MNKAVIYFILIEVTIGEETFLISATQIVNSNDNNADNFVKWMNEVILNKEKDIGDDAICQVINAKIIKP